jgi:hypothetical protein
MDEFFDSLARIVATPMSRRSTLRLILATLAIQTFGRPAEAQGTDYMWPPLTKTKKQQKTQCRRDGIAAPLGVSGTT